MKASLGWLIHSALQARLGQKMELGRLYFEYRRFAENGGAPITAREQLEMLRPRRPARRAGDASVN